MRRRSFRITACVLLSTAIAATGLFGQDAAQQLVRGNTQFALDLYQRLRQRDGNLLFSPFSISTVGILAYRGARAETARQLAAAFHLDLADSDLFPAFLQLPAGVDAAGHGTGIELLITNSRWPQKRYPLLPDDLDFVRSIPTTDIIPVDYAGDPEGARQSINSWVKQKTRSLIVNILKDPLSRGARLFLVNAISFKGPWKYRFPAPSTADAPFYLDGGGTVTAKMMTHEALLRCWSDDLVQVLELPTLENGLTVDYLATWLRSLLKQQRVRVVLPRFEFVLSTDLVDSLQSLGVIDAFDMRKADFSGMDGMPNWLYADTVVHKASVHVDGEGTVAAAAMAAGGCFPAGTAVLTEDGPRAIEKVDAGTRVLAVGDVLVDRQGAGATITALSRRHAAIDVYNLDLEGFHTYAVDARGILVHNKGGAEPALLLFRADHPFLFLIRESATGSILFIGRVSDPTASGG
jgi:serpin B